MKTIGTVVVLLFLYFGIFGANIKNNTLVFKCKPYIKEWVSSSKAEKTIEKVENIKENISSTVDSVSDKTKELTDLKE